MILDERTWEHLVNALKEYIHTKVDPKWFVANYEPHRILLDDVVVQVLKSIDTHISGILENAPKSYRSKIRRALEHVSRNIDKTLIFLDNPPEWFRNIMLVAALNDFGVPVYPHTMIEEHAEELAKVIPFRAEVETAGIKRTAVVLYPDDEELRSMRFDAVNTFWDIISMLPVRATYEPVKQSINVHGYEIFFPRSAYYKILERKKKDDIMKKMIEEDLQNIIPELEALGTVEHESPTKLRVKLANNIVNYISRHSGLNVKEAVLTVSLYPSTSSGTVGLTAKVDTQYGQLVIVVARGYPRICVSGNCANVPEREIEFKDFAEIPKAAWVAIERAKEVLAFTKIHLDRFTEAARRYGFEVSNISHYYGVTSVEATKFLNRTVVSVTMTITYSDGRASLTFDVKLPLERTPKVDVPEAALARLGERLSDYKIWAHKGWSISPKLSFSAEEMDEAFRKALAVAEALETAYEQYLYEKEQKKSIKVPQEDYVAVYITNLLRSFFHGSVIDVERVLGRPMIAVYGAVRSVLAKHAPNAANLVGDSPLEVAYSLFASKYITVDRELRLYINGKRYTDIVIKYGLSPTEAEAKERLIATKLVAEHIYRNQDVPATVALRRIGLLSDSVVEALMLGGYHYFRPEEMAAEIDGKPAWHYLSPQTKMLYLSKMPVTELSKILFDPKLREVFSDVIEHVKRAVLESRNPSLVTRYAVEHMPDAIGLPKNAKIVSEGELYAIDVGAFLVQVRSIGRESHEFIVYNKTTKVGFLFRAKTVSEAVANAAERYEKIYAVFTKLLELANEGKLTSEHSYRIGMVYTDLNGYKFYYLISHKSIPRDDNVYFHGVIHIDERTFDKLEKLKKGTEAFDEYVEVRV